MKFNLDNEPMMKKLFIALALMLILSLISGLIFTIWTILCPNPITVKIALISWLFFIVIRGFDLAQLLKDNHK